MLFHARIYTHPCANVMITPLTIHKFRWVEIELCGHMAPQFQPGAAYRQLEYLLGRIDKL